MIAAQNGHLDVVQFLMDNGADMNAVSKVSFFLLMNGGFFYLFRGYSYRCAHVVVQCFCT